MFVCLFMCSGGWCFIFLWCDLSDESWVVWRILGRRGEGGRGVRGDDQFVRFPFSLDNLIPYRVFFFSLPLISSSASCNLHFLSLSFLKFFLLPNIPHLPYCVLRNTHNFPITLKKKKKRKKGQATHHIPAQPLDGSAPSFPSAVNITRRSAWTRPTQPSVTGISRSLKKLNGASRSATGSIWKTRRLG